MIKISALVIVLCLACGMSVKEPYISSIQTNYRNDTNGVIYSKYYCSDGRAFIDTSNKYSVWQHIDR